MKCQISALAKSCVWYFQLGTTGRIRFRKQQFTDYIRLGYENDVVLMSHRYWNLKALSASRQVTNTASLAEPRHTKVVYFRRSRCFIKIAERQVARMSWHYNALFFLLNFLGHFTTIAEMQLWYRRRNESWCDLAVTFDISNKTKYKMVFYGDFLRIYSIEYF